MKAILIVDLDDTFMPLDKDTITLEKGTIKYRNINRLPFKITVEGLRLKPLPNKKVGDDLYERYGSWTLGDEKEFSYRVGFNDCIGEILGDTE